MAKVKKSRSAESDEGKKIDINMSLMFKNIPGWHSLTFDPFEGKI